MLSSRLLYLLSVENNKVLSLQICWYTFVVTTAFCGNCGWAEALAT